MTNESQGQIVFYKKSFEFEVGMNEYYVSVSERNV